MGTSFSCPTFVANPFQHIRFNCFFVGSLPSAFENKLESQYVGCQTRQIFQITDVKMFTIILIYDYPNNGITSR